MGGWVERAGSGQKLQTWLERYARDRREGPAVQGACARREVGARASSRTGWPKRGKVDGG